jgi:chromatin segregation and condensation protein Rec8/ScpA/Scc1 (kleisin family)
MAAYLLGLDTRELMVLQDALALLEDYEDEDTRQALERRLCRLHALDAWAEQFLRHAGIGQSRGRPQG